MDLKKLHYFIAVAEELHFNRAAKKLNMTQPPLSQQIQVLEEELGVKLFERTKRQVRLTPAGAVFLEESRSLVAQLEQSIRKTQLAGQGKTGNLSIAFVDSAVGGTMVEVLKAYREKFPDVQLTLTEMTTTQQLKALHDKKIDVGFLRSAGPSAHINSRLYANESLLAVLPVTHPLAAQMSLSIHALADEPFIMPPHNKGAAFHELIFGFCGKHGFQPRIVQEAVQMYTIVNLVAAGIGISIVPSSVSAFRREDVVFRSFSEITPSVPLYASWKSDSDAVLTNFLNILEEKTAAEALAPHA
ncbi:LysR substrate-binding domain-containing protein [Paenibacillus sp. UNC499MF]|uniref:LysR substrate-binding domain-containing protein n=1 Tax=Paenibacillus sp. UNC499MF TaxID=1502751 RepID=UPI0008A007ED|nr:LysR substrate-binding domain-containing protein [Paenibacillus sp. UNC499MF]SEG74926.1 DNA-binding transcriptional regulator, LysR family [Paenibacillus sp. UNC499MF]